MEPVRRAVIDVGTNSIKLLVAEVAGRQVRPLLEESKQTRLGKGLYETRRLGSAAIAATAKAVADFVNVARECQAGSIRIIATSAAREAVNSKELISALELASGMRVAVISGEQEADWAFLGATSDPEMKRQAILLLDVGGGSAQFILGKGQHTHFRHSFALGTVRLMETIPHSDPPKPGELAACRQWLRNFLQTEVVPRLEPALRREAQSCSAKGGLRLIGTGGTASILGCLEAQLDRFDRQRLEATRLSRARLTWHVERLWGLPLEERKQIVGLPPNRADVILTGAAIYEAVMERFGFEELRISTRGLRFAAVMEA